MADPSCRAEYVALVGSFFLVGLEAIIRILTLALRMRTSSFRDETGLIGRSNFYTFAILSSVKAALQSSYICSSKEVGIEEIGYVEIYHHLSKC